MIWETFKRLLDQAVTGLPRNLTFMAPYILVMYDQLKLQLNVLFICIFIPLYIYVYMFRVLLHPSLGTQMELSAICVCNGFGMLIHCSR
jgi:hypothetical protein